MDLTSSKHDFQKNGEQITGYSISETYKKYKIIKYRDMGLSEPSLTPFSCLSHCKVPCDSPCCVKICGEDNHCNVNTGTHETIISDSEEEHTETK